MSKENKMTYDGMKYVTKIGDDGSCEDCAFLDFYLGCTLENENAKKVCTSGNKEHIWVEDTPKTNEKKTMSKEHKMVHEGKKYKTIKTSNCCPPCNGCVFHSLGDHQCPIVSNSTTRQCVHHNNEDGINRIWVEDKSKNKPAKTKGNDYYWIVEELIEGIGDQQWIGVAFHVTRSCARDAQQLYLRKTRIRKFVPAK
jgi:hypothetical protein